MRILHLNQYGSCIGGVENYIADVARALVEIGHQSALVYFDPAERNNTIVIPGATFLVTGNSQREVLLQLESFMHDFQPDVAYIHAVYEPLLVRWIAGKVPALAYVHGPYLVCPGFSQYLRRSAQVCLRRSGVPCLLSAQLERCCFGRNPVRHLDLLRRVFKFIDVYRNLPILVGSEYMRHLLSTNGIPVENIDLLPPFLLPNHLQPPAAKSPTQKILFAGRLVPEKGLSALIEALAHVRGEWELIVAGEGPERIPNVELARRYGLAERIHFLGWRTKADMLELYRQCALVVVPSLWPEPFGRIGPEAACYGCPAVAFDVGGVRAWLDDGVTGYLAPAKDTRTLAAHIETVLDNPGRCQQLGEQAYERAVTRWARAKHLHHLIEYLSKAITNWNWKR